MCKGVGGGALDVVAAIGPVLPGSKEAVHLRA